MDKDNTRNTVIFFVCAFALMAIYQLFVLGPMQKRQQLAAQAQAQAHQAQVQAQPLAAAQPGASVFVNRDQALAQSPRVAIDTPSVKGSVALKGGRIDDLYLKGYRETLDKDSPPVELFRPEGAKQAYFADFGWTGQAGAATDASTLWTAADTEPLTTAHPMVLTYDNGQGLKFTRTITVDPKFLFTVTDTVANTGSAPVQLASYATVQRQGEPGLTPGIFEGAVGSKNGLLDVISFKDMTTKGGRNGETTGGWVGLTDKYWLAALIPDQKEHIHSAYRVTSANGVNVFDADYVGQPRTVQPGQSVNESRHLFAGAKDATVLDSYQKALGTTHLIDAIDWGWLWFLSRPVDWLLSHFIGLTGSVGIAIMLLTLVRVILTFPLYNKSFASAAEMRKLQPEVEALRARFKEDQVQLQQATMNLYKERKVNPLAGCVPALIPIPVFLALSKVFTVSLDLRHAHFLGVPDLSAADPSSFLNLFGLIPWNVAATPMVGSILDGPLHIGWIAILYGLTQWMIQAMSPTTTGIDPVQRQIFMLMPLVFTFFMAHFASGLLIYWVWSSLLTIVQQYVIMHRHGTENPIDTLIQKLRGRSAASPA